MLPYFVRSGATLSPDFLQHWPAVGKGTNSVPDSGHHRTKLGFDWSNHLAERLAELGTTTDHKHLLYLIHQYYDKLCK